MNTCFIFDSITILTHNVRRYHDVFAVLISDRLRKQLVTADWNLVFYVTIIPIIWRFRYGILYVP